MNKELKIALALLAVLTGVSTLLIGLLTEIRFCSKEFIGGFFPFLLFLVPYILWSVNSCVVFSTDWIHRALWKKFLFPFCLLATYTIFTTIYSTFQWALLFKLSLWVMLPTAVFCFIPKNSYFLPEFAAALMLWLPIEFGWLSGFDIIFTPGITIPALALAAPIFGLYLFAVLRNLPDIGFSFQWQAKDLLRAGASILALAVLLIPLGTSLGFIRYSVLDTSIGEVLKLLFGIYFLVALPEELLFRGIIQNLLSKAFSFRPYSKFYALALASLIFGFSHWNNFSPPDWRYVFLASVAGMLYGWTYWKTGKATVSALVHCGVNLFWAILFKDSAG